MSLIHSASLLALFASVTPVAPVQEGGSFAGAVYAMSNDFDGNTIVAYGRNDDGTLQLIGEYATGGLGAAFDGGEGLDPLISAYALIPSDDQRFLFAVNAGSNSISAFRVRQDRSLALTAVVPSHGYGPNSLAFSDGFLYVTNIDADGVFAGEPDQEGSFIGYRVSDRGRLRRIPDSYRILGNRPSAVRVSPDGDHLVIASINAGSAALASGSADELVVYALGDLGNPSASPVATGASTLPGNAENRNLPSAIGFEIVEQDDRQFVVVTEAREFQADGSPPAFPALQTGSVSTWELEADGGLTPIQLDVLAGNDFFDGERTACWLDFSVDGSVFWVSNALESTLSTFSFDAGEITLLERVAAAGAPPSDDDPFGTTDGWIDLWISADGAFLYQLFGLDGTIGVYAITDQGLSFVQEISGDLPEVNTQGIVAF